MSALPRWGSCRRPPAAAAAALALLATLSATGSADGAPADCVLLLSALDDEGRTVFQSIAHALEEPGLFVTAGSALARVRGLRLRVRADSVPPVASGAPEVPSGYEVAGLVGLDAGRALAVLRSPGLPGCRPPAVADAGDAGDALVGIRPRNGFRPRLFEVFLKRRVEAPDGNELMLMRVPDGGGAESGFVLDPAGRLVGLFLPPPAGSDGGLACAVRVEEPAAAPAGAPAHPPLRPLDDAPEAAAFASGPAGLLAQALLLTRDDQAARAIGLLDRVIAGGAPTAPVLSERGVLAFRIGRTDAAIRDLARAAALDPASSLAPFNLGVALGSEGRYAEAAGAFTRALEIRPDLHRARFHLALALKAAGRGEQALMEYARLLPLDPALASQLRPVLAP
ncbi:MAG: tetratricopeptide repeat protein [Candidatus Polarisedimenticolia bacterium]